MSRRWKHSWAARGAFTGGAAGAIGSIVIFVMSLVSPDGALVLTGSYVLGRPLSHWLIYSVGVPTGMQVPASAVGMIANGAFLGVAVSAVLRHIFGEWITTRWRASQIGIMVSVLLGTAFVAVYAFREGRRVPLGPIMPYALVLGIVGAIVGFRYWEPPEE